MTERQELHLVSMALGAELEWVFEDSEDYDKGGAWFLNDEYLASQDVGYRPEPVTVEDAIALQESGYLEQLTVIGDVWGYKHEQ